MFLTRLNRCVFTFAVCAGFLVLATSASAQRPSRSPMPGSVEVNPGGMSNLSISGFVTEAGSYARLENAQVELHAFSGAIVSTSFTHGNGEFEFANLRPGTYILEVKTLDGQNTMQTVELFSGCVFGLEVVVQARTSASNSRPAAAGRPTVSLRDLAVPEKAQEALAKGMQLLYRKSDVSGSLKEFQRAIKAYPNFAEAYAQMGVAYAQSGDTASSEQALRKAVDLGQGHYPAVYWVLAGVFSGERRFSEAEPMARKAVDLAPRAWQSNFELARALLGLNRAPDAEGPAQAATNAQPDNPLPYLVLANVHGQLRKYSAQLGDLNQYLRLAPTGQYAAEVRTRRDQIEQFLAKTGPIQQAPRSPQPPH